MKLIKSNGRFLKSTAVFMLLLGVSLAGHGQENYSAGHLAGNNLGSGVQNTLVGDYAGENVTGGNDNTFIGRSAGRGVKDSGHNTFVGAYAGWGHDGDLDDDANSFFGYRAGRNNKGDNNSFFGAFAGQHNEFGSKNCFFGISAGRTSTNSNNVFIGPGAGYDSQGDNNVYIGYEAGMSADNSANSSCVFIGDQAGSKGSFANNQLYISPGPSSDNPLIWGDFEERIVKVNGRMMVSEETDLYFPFHAGEVNVSDYKLYVDGGILAKEAFVYSSWADYVFEADYELQPLGEVAAFIAEKGHLPNVPSASEIETGGLKLGAISKVQQEKIEELFLHLIQMEEWLSDLDRENEHLKEVRHAAGR